MSLASVKADLARRAPDLLVIETGQSSATVALAASAHGVAPDQIAKTLSLRIGERVVLVVASGLSRLDNRKASAALGGKPRMLGADEVERLTGHPVGGVCPFGLPQPLPIYLDRSLHAHGEVVPAAGSTHAAVRLTPTRLAEVTGGEWADICSTPDGEEVRA